MSTPAAQEILKMAGLKGQAGGATSSSAPAPSARSRSPPVGAAASSLQHRPRSRSRSARRALQHRDAQRNLLSQLAGVLNSAYEEELKLDAFRPKIWLSYIDSAVNPKTHSLLRLRHVCCPHSRLCVLRMCASGSSGARWRRR